MDCQELVNLLSAHLPHDPTSRRAILGVALGLNTPILNQIDFNGPSSDFAARLVDSLFKRDKKMLIKLVDHVGSQIGDDQRQKLWRALARCLDTSGNQIHVLTSTKGGVGKTLLSLSAFFAYRKYLERNVVCFDANSMNPDLFRILQLYANGNRPSRVLNFLRESQVNEDIIIVSSNPYQILEAQQFWQILEALHSGYQGRDLVVDTNYHIANIAQSIPMQAKRIFIWVVWTWASLHDSRAIIEAMIRAENQGVKVIHVFNPSALVQPELDLEVIKFMYGTLRHLESLKPAKQAARIKEFIRGELERSLAGDASRGEDEVPGLSQFSRLPVSQYMPANTFSLVYIDVLKEGIRRSSDGELFTFTELGRLSERPWNILPVTTHASGLKGYTERHVVMRPTLEDFERQLEPIILNVRKLLLEAEEA